MMSLEELEAYFNGIDLPEKVKLVQGVLIEDVPLFIASHISFVKGNPDLRSAEVFLQRLQRLQEVIEEKSNK